MARDWDTNPIDGAPALSCDGDTLAITDDEVIVNIAMAAGEVVVRARFPRHMIENMLRTIAADETRLLMGNGWKPLGRHGWWHRPPGGASTTKGDALKMVREQLKKKEEENVTDS